MRPTQTFVRLRSTDGTRPRRGVRGGVRPAVGRERGEERNESGGESDRVTRAGRRSPTPGAPPRRARVPRSRARSWSAFRRVRERHGGHGGRLRRGAEDAAEEDDLGLAPPRRAALMFQLQERRRQKRQENDVRFRTTRCIAPRTARPCRGARAARRAAARDARARAARPSAGARDPGGFGRARVARAPALGNGVRLLGGAALGVRAVGAPARGRVLARRAPLRDAGGDAAFARGRGRRRRRRRDESRNERSFRRRVLRVLVRVRVARGAGVGVDRDAISHTTRCLLCIS